MPTSLFNHLHHADPYPAYRALRANGALHWDADFCGGAWLLSDYADVASALRDPRFTVQRAGAWINSSGPHAATELRAFKQIFARSLMFMDGSQHSVLRQALAPAFKASAIAARAPRIECIVNTLIDRLSNDGFDFIRDFARPLPALVIADLLGIDADANTDMRQDFINWSDDIAAFIGAPTPDMTIALTAQRALLAMADYFQMLLQQNDDSLISQLRQAQGRIVSGKQLLAQYCTLLFAGHETTRNLLGNGMLALLQHPQQARLLHDTPTLMPLALKEFLRFDSPVQYTGRRLTTDLMLHGQRLKKGQLVILLIGAANRDPAKFSDPDRLDICRDQGNHLAFGYGPHVCIGAALSYLEADIAFRTLQRRLPQLQQTTAHRWSDNQVYRGLSSLPLQALATVSAPIASHA